MFIIEYYDAEGPPDPQYLTHNTKIGVISMLDELLEHAILRETPVLLEVDVMSRREGRWSFNE